jgi:hypothetical protein
MIECSACHTLNPAATAACLICGVALTAARPGPATQARCPAGHPIDPSWRTCPYCDRLQAAPALPRPAATKLEVAPDGARAVTDAEIVSAAAAGGASAGLQGAASPLRATRLEVRAAPVVRQTVLSEVPTLGADATAARPAGEARPAPAAAGETRRLVAVLAAPDLQPGGAVFAVRAGKNTLGASRASDICLAQDRQVSGEHAVLLYRGGRFLLADRMSTNGTLVNEREVPADGTIEVYDRDCIRCGGVELQLLTLAGTCGLPPGGESSI